MATSKSMFEGYGEAPRGRDTDRSIEMEECPFCHKTNISVSVYSSYDFSGISVNFGYGTSYVGVIHCEECNAFVLFPSGKNIENTKKLAVGRWNYRDKGHVAEKDTGGCE